MDNIKKALSSLHPDLSAEIEDHAIIQNFQQDEEIIRTGQYIKVIPLVIDGLIKVFTRHEEKELLLYYIKPMESCIMSFSAGLENAPSRIFAVAEEETTALLLPAEKVKTWTKEYNDLNVLFFRLYNTRYSDLLDTINHILFNKMDVRLFDYLKEKSELTGKRIFKISHRQIASELGTAREVVTRVLKKLEKEGKVKQAGQSIEMMQL